jgi:hypothetical protein
MAVPFMDLLAVEEASAVAACGCYYRRARRKIQVGAIFFQRASKSGPEHRFRRAQRKK